MNDDWQDRIARDHFSYGLTKEQTMKKYSITEEEFEMVTKNSSQNPMDHKIRTAIKAYLDSGGDPEFYILSKRDAMQVHGKDIMIRFVEFVLDRYFGDARAVEKRQLDQAWTDFLQQLKDEEAA